MLAIRNLRPLEKQEGRNDGHQRRSEDGASNTDHRGEIVKENAHSHTGENHHDGHEGQLPVRYDSIATISLTRVLEVEHLHDGLTDGIAVQREGEAQSEGDDQSSHQNQLVQSRVAVQHVRRLEMTRVAGSYGVAAEAEVSRHGIHHVQREDEEVREEDDGSDTLLGGLLHVRHDRDELHLRAMAEAEDGQHGEQVLVENETPQLDVKRKAKTKRRT